MADTDRWRKLGIELISGYPKHAAALREAADACDAKDAELKHIAQDWADDHTHLQAACRAVGCDENAVAGDSYAVPDIQELGDMLKAACDARDAEIARLNEALAELRARSNGQRRPPMADTPENVCLWCGADCSFIATCKGLCLPCGDRMQGKSKRELIAALAAAVGQLADQHRAAALLAETPAKGG